MGIQLIKGDITQADLINDVIASYRVTSILHAGGISGPILYKDDPCKGFDVNSNGTLNIAEAARRNDVKRIVFLAPFVAYGEQKDQNIVDENRMQCGSDSYAASKISAETYYEAIAKSINSKQSVSNCPHCTVQEGLQIVLFTV